MARIAIIGTGISGLGAAYLLNPGHDITVYEKAPRLGGHSRTVTVEYDGKQMAVDTGFIVFNPRNYPNLTGLFAHLGVATHKSDMTFGTTIRQGWLEWGAADLNAVLGQRRNIFRPKFAGMVRDVMAFNRGAEAFVAKNPTLTLAQMMDAMKLGDWFRHYYLLPMAGAIWSCPASEMQRFPAQSLVRFFANHHLLSFTGQPQWYTVTGGSQEYVRALAAPFAHKIRTNCGAVAITRQDGQVQVRDARGQTHAYDQLVLACHGDEALALLGDADSPERDALSGFRYQKNRAVLHRDTSVMPRRRRCWSSWIYHSDGVTEQQRITVSYWMNRLQDLDASRPLFVSLNPQTEIAADKIFDQAEFDHPVFDQTAIASQEKIARLQGARRTWFCGAHLGYGFHEDGLASAVHVARLLGSQIPWAQDAAQQNGPALALAAE